MVDEQVVWLVPLRRGRNDEYKGVLTLEPAALVFVERKEGERVEIALSDIRRAKRVRGSPVLLISIGDRGSRAEVAFYFTQPPPLQPAETSESKRPSVAGLAPGSGGSRKGKKRVIRTNVAYLNNANVQKKALVETWVAAIQKAISERRS